MKKSEKIKKKISDYLFDHLALRVTLDGVLMLLLSVSSGLIFALGFTCFIAPLTGSGDTTVITGGVSGISQTVYLIISFFNDEITVSQVTSVGYFVFNIPLLIFAYLKIGKKFAIYTLINILSSSLFMWLIPLTGFSEAIQELFATPSNFEGTLYVSGMIVRVVFGALCTGVSSAIAYRGNLSCGGIDIITYYFALRKSTSVGKYSVLVNSIIFITYTALSIGHHSSIGQGDLWARDLICLLFAVAYQFVVALIVDSINVRNKKVQVQIITSKDFLPQLLVANFPHTCTVMNGQGAYSKTDRYVLYMVVSSSEVNRVVLLSKKADPHVFISVTNLSQVYGNFFIKPVE